MVVTAQADVYVPKIVKMVVMKIRVCAIPRAVVAAVKPVLPMSVKMVFCTLVLPEFSTLKAKSANWGVALMELHVRIVKPINVRKAN